MYSEDDKLSMEDLFEALDKLIENLRESKEAEEKDFKEDGTVHTTAVTNLQSLIDNYEAREVELNDLITAINTKIASLNDDLKAANK
jgi:predicted RNase H-like nuclease (RuvC/YqgF family)